MSAHSTATSKPESKPEPFASTSLEPALQIEPLAKTRTNTTGQSRFPITAKPEPALFLDTATGDIVLVPAEDITEFRNEFLGLSYVMADFQASNT